MVLSFYHFVISIPPSEKVNNYLISKPATRRNYVVLLVEVTLEIFEGFMADLKKCKTCKE